MLLSLAAFCGPVSAQPPDVPPPLRDWQDWVLDGREYLRCPIVDGGSMAGSAEERICVWPGALAIDADGRGASFEQTLQVHAAGFVPLPGDDTTWPQDVALDGRAAPVVARGGRPHLWLEAGTHRVSGRIAWSAMPESLAIPATYSLIELTVGGRRIDWPERSGESLRLGAARELAQDDHLEVQVYRKLTDAIPGLLRTRILLNVAGRPREEPIGPMLPAGFVPMQLDAPLPVRLQPDGRVRVQVRPGNWVIELVARSASAVDAVRVPASGVGSEVWSFEAVDWLRSVTVEGMESIDPAQANVPSDWRELPAYRVEAGTELALSERSRGLTGQDLNRIEVERNLWWDFEGSGYTFQDFVRGTMRQGWRLEMAAPYGLQGARQGEQSLLITQGADGRAGVELRSPDLGVEATGRLARSGALPAAGWDTRLAHLALNLRLPPGHRLLAAPGVDSSPSAWLDRWRLLDVFAVLLVAAAAFRIAGVPAAVLALAAFALTHLELPGLTWAALNLLIAIAVVRALPDSRIRRWLGLWRAVSIAIVVLLLVPFAFTQARLALFPQLEPLDWQAPESVVVTGARPDQGEGVAYEPPPAEDRLSGRAFKKTEKEAAVAVDSDRQTSLATPTAPPPTPARSAAVIERYAPGTRLQNGPGVPRWNFQVHRLEWSGPVEPTQRMRLLVLTPVWLSLWRLAAIVLAALAFYAILRAGFPGAGLPRLDRWLRIGPAAGAVALAMVLPFATPEARAQAPSPELLEELQNRLSRAPRCVPDCVSIARAQVDLGDGVLEIRLEAHAQAQAALALPGAAQRWQPDRVLVDGAPAPGLARGGDGTLRVALPEGVHNVSLRGGVPDTDTLRLVFPERPARIAVSAPEWQVAGIDDGRLLADSLNLTRPARGGPGERTDADGGAGAPEEFPPFVRLTRTLALGLDWTVTTSVERLAPEQGAFALRVPLLPGESVLTAGVPVADGELQIGMPAGVARVGWTSALARADALELIAPSAAPYVEVWRFEVGPAWRLRFEGTPEVLGPEPVGGVWVHRFEPRPGERLAVAVARPEAIAGATFAFESVRQTLTPGRRSTDVILQLDYRSTQGGRHEIRLPEGARVREVLADGQPLVLRDQDGRLELPLLPGTHTLQIDWQVERGYSVATRPGTVALAAPASNVTTTIALPPSRWLLAAAGGGVGPAILYWAELAVFVALALLLGGLGRTPLATHEWLLVGLGLSTFSWGVLLIFAAWVFALEWRRRWTAEVRPWVFDGTQIALALLTLVALGSLLAAIPNGLLGSPDMHVSGSGSHAGQLEWLHDRVDGELPRPVVVSVSIWFYKAAMLAWALWLSFALVRWVRWAWAAFSAGRFWRPMRLRPQIG
jgi:hypothetical protein